MIRTAILFKTHFWSREVELNFESIINNSKNSDIFIIIDNENIEIIPEEIRKSYSILRYDTKKASEIGLMISNENEGGFWYNGDYHQNIFIKYHDEYEYICAVEHDVYVDVNIDNIFSRMHNEEIDVICKIQRIPNSNWSHLENCSGYYDKKKYINKGLFCISFFSKRSANLILEKRLEMLTRKEQEKIPSWPIGECVMIHEPIMANHRVLDLEKFCSNLSMYDWAPSYLHCQITKSSNTVYHPVSNLEKYLYTNFHQPYNSFATGDVAHMSKSMVDIIYINNYFIYAEAYSSTSNLDYKLEILNQIKKSFPVFDNNWVDIAYQTNYADLYKITYNNHLNNIPIHEKFLKMNSSNSSVEINIDGSVDMDMFVLTSSEILSANQKYESVELSRDLFFTRLFLLERNISFSLENKEKIYGLYFAKKINTPSYGETKIEDAQKISTFSKEGSVNAYVISYDNNEKIITVSLDSVYRMRFYCYNFDSKLLNKQIKIDVNSGIITLV